MGYSSCGYCNELIVQSIEYCSAPIIGALLFYFSKISYNNTIPSDFMMTYYSLSALFNFAIGLSLGIFVLYKNPKSKLNKSLFFWCFTVSFWSFFYFLWQVETKETFALLWTRILMLGAIWIPLAYFRVVLIFLNLHGKYRKYLIVNYVLCVIFSFLLFTPLMVARVEPLAGFAFWPKPGFAYALFLVMFIGFAIYSVYISFRSLRTEPSALKRIQIKYMILGIAISLIGGSTNYFLWYDIPIKPYGNIFASTYVLFTVYAIMKYRLMDITIKVVAAELFAGLLVIIAIFPVFEVKSLPELLFRLFIIIITLVFAVLLVRSVLHEVHRREEMEALNKKLNKVTKDLASANKELKRLDESKSEFLSISSHQLRTPLTIIKGYSSMLLEGSFGKMSKPVKESIDKIFVSTERLINLVESLLNISRIEAGRIEFNIEPVDLAEVAKSMVNDFQEKAKARKLKLAFMSGEKVPKVAADAQKIKDIVSNIIDNAIKYTKQGEIMVGLHQEGTSVVFTSQDTGIGMEADDIKRLFNKFTRGKDSAKVNTEGTGLGLYYARVLVENMGGRIWVESPGKNKGSKFCFSLPMADKSLAKKIKS